MSTPPTRSNVSQTAVELPARISIDASDGPNRFLRNMRSGFPAATSHPSVTTALGNIANDSEVSLVGHGIKGVVNTGQGEKFVPPVKDQHIGVHNTDFWKKEIEKLAGTKIKLLVIFACNTGAGETGARLVFELSKALNATVRAPTGFVSCDDVTKKPFLVGSAVWQEATPAMAEPPAAKAVDRLSPPGAVPRPPALLVFDEARFLPLPIAATDDLRIRHRDMETRRERWHRCRSADFARQAIAHISFNMPLILGGPLASLITGRLFLTVSFLGGKIDTEFLIHNDHLLEDTRAPGVFFEIDLPAVLGAMTHGE